MPVGIGEEHRKEVEKQDDQQLERFPQCPIETVAEKIRQGIGKGCHGREEVNQSDEEDEPHRVYTVTDIPDEPAGLLTDTDVEIAQHDQDERDEPGNGGLFKIAGESLPELFEGVDGVLAAQHLEHGVVQCGKGGTCRHDRHREKDEHDVRRDHSADPGHDAPE